MKPYDNDKTKKEQIRDMFDRIAPTYDGLNRTMSLGLDGWWRRRTVRLVAETSPRRILDVAAGTGDLSIALARRIKDAEVTGVDLSENMLEEARRKAAAALPGRSVGFECGDAEHLSAADGSFDAVTVAFGVRNFGDIGAGLRELLRVLRSGGMLAVLELSVPRNAAVRTLYNLYARMLLPRIGAAVSDDAAAYRYLPASIEEFPQPERFAAMLHEAGFTGCRIRSLTFGTVHIYTAFKP
ncbi:MAG: bifunctional demethylmenaquinone methyltransferase/2-methoxy-6-polyprenyl-1,4-benzoquinol methylase UbiE [Alistipes sp.]|nr:bifunctional demethylmenaquinone methyltransferase/2-methoxy-6-polyprenyl-1,4-benzoquinol methylase UbiE [Alistipes sp.]